MPKESKQNGKKQQQDDFAMAEKTSFVTVPKLDSSKLSMGFQLDKTIIPSLSTKIDYNQNDNLIKENTDSRPQPISKKEKRKIKKDQFLQKFNPTLNLNINKKQMEQDRLDLSKSGDFVSSIDLLKESISIPSKKKAPKMTNEKKKKISIKESNQFKTVLAHPVYQSNPFTTLQEHLTNSIALQNQKIKDQQDAHKALNRKRKTNNNKMDH
ncbi:hypothetical protein CYY_009354 [Polysphondylium violaceum]|uniref:Ribosome biogenesis protein SLX9 n=1 Tax=Polysphondylium violaceum TaxID=133409 RepID=A0A8J4PTT1_9MYCE|nr:hypothetical protein CYY_009354 [Polysphondylium violaceum]